MYLQCPGIPSTTVVDICLRQPLSVLIHNLSFEVMNKWKSYICGNYAIYSLRSGSDQQRCSNQLRLWSASEVEL